MLTVSDGTEDKGPSVAAILAGVGSGVVVITAAVVIFCAIKR